MSQESNELLREVTSSLRNDKLKEFYHKHCRKIFIGLGVATLLIAVIVGQNIYATKQNEKYSRDIQNSITAQQSGQISESKQDLEKVFYDESAPGNLKAIAGFRLAAVYLSEDIVGNTKKVISIYKVISECESCDSYSKDLAGMLWVKFNITNNKETKYEELIEEIKAIENASQKFRYEIAIDRAFYELEQGHFKKSLEVFEFVANSLEAADGTKETAKKGVRIVEQKMIK